MPGNSANKLTTKTFKEEVLAAIARLDRSGYSQHEIVRALPAEAGVKLSQPMVCVYLQKIRKRYREQTVGERAELVAEQVAGLMDVYREAKEAWERSKEDARKLKTVKAWRKGEGVKSAKQKGKVKIADGVDQKGRPKFVVVSEELVREGRLPAAAYLNTMLECRREICKLRGLYPDEELTVKGVLAWDQLLQGVPPAPGDIIEGEVLPALEDYTGNGADGRAAGEGGDGGH